MNHSITSLPLNKKIEESKIFDETTREKMRKHISDINDVITEDDIRNIRTDIYNPFAVESNPKNA